MKKSGLLAVLLCISITISAQDLAPKKVLCNPLVLGQPAAKRLSLSYEAQTGFTAPTNFSGRDLPAFNDTKATVVQGIRAGYTKNLVVKPKLYVSFAAGYWYSRFSISNPDRNSLAQVLDNSHFHSITASSNIFKPLNAKNFLLLNVSVEANGNSTAFKKFGANTLLAGGALIYGWKKGLTRMWGVGVFRGYRLGRVIHVPALLYNHSFNKKWGVDALLPARANFRYTPNLKQMWLFGYELDGTQFALRSNTTQLDNTFFQRGEIRPKIGLEQQLNKYILFTCNAGVRINGRFVVADDYKGDNSIIENTPPPGFFMNVGVHVLKFNKKKKK
jgi:hypothetical protein